MHGPDFTPLIPGVLSSLSDLDAVVISHGHFDHIGYLPALTKMCAGVPIYATSATKRLAQYLMMDLHPSGGSSWQQRLAGDLAMEKAIDRLIPVSYTETVSVGAVRLRLYEAGHVPGAAMVLIESEQEGSFLYSGDFCRTPTALTPGYCLPQTLSTDYLLLCGLDARDPARRRQKDPQKLLRKICAGVASGQACFVPAHDLTKGAEIVGLLSKLQEQTGQSFPIFVDDLILALSERLQEEGIPVLGPRCRRFPRDLAAPQPGIYIGRREHGRWFQAQKEVRFSLHDDFEDTSRLIGRLRPESVLLVHSPPGRDGARSIRELTFLHPETRFILPKQGEFYAV